MQTFMPYSNIWRVAKCLDNKRLGKQRVECKQILIALGIGVGDHKGNAASRWRNHPAVLMWRGYECRLAEYATAMCIEWKRRGYKDTLLDQFRLLTSTLSDDGCVPTWLRDIRLHSSHRSNLLRKDRAHYGQFGWLESDDIPYFWPSCKGFAGTKTQFSSVKPRKKTFSQGA